MSLTQNDVDHEQRNKSLLKLNSKALNRIQFEDELLLLLMHCGGTGRELARCQKC